MRPRTEHTRRRKLGWSMGLLLLLGVASSQGQTLYFDGVGRAIISNDKLEGDLTTDDSLSIKKATSGYTLLDLGVNVRPSEQFKARAVLRARNTFGRFGGSGVALNIREFQVEGVLKKGIYYEIGDIDLEMTPYTLYNFDDMWHQYESGISEFRRQIVEYENFNDGHQWRLQGMQSQATLTFARGVKKADLFAFATRTRPSDQIGIPDRLLAGGSARLLVADDVTVHGNAVRFFDIPGDEADVIYANNVFTGGIDAKKSFGDVQAGLNLETGLSDYNYEQPGDTVVAFDDFFYDASLKGLHAPSGFSLTAGYRDVGPQFSSPSAQTRKIDPTQTPDLFNTVLNNTTARELMLFDRYAQENLYNGAISPVLLPFLPAFGNAMPYGKATPNRRGFFVQLEKSDSVQSYGVEAGYHNYNEIIGEGTVDLRNFGLIRAGGFINVGQLTGLENEVRVSVGYQQETTTREGLSAVDLNSTLIDLGVSAEVVTDLHLMLGWKAMSASGNEFISTRDAFNGIDAITDTNLNMENKITSLALKYFFSGRSFFTAQWHKAAVVQLDDSASNYDINQFWLNYTVQF